MKADDLRTELSITSALRQTSRARHSIKAEQHSGDSHVKTPEQLVEGRLMARPLGDAVLACCVYIDIEQRQPTPDNTLIALLCDFVRLAREAEDHYRYRATRDAASPVRQLLRDETKKQAQIGHLPREVGVMYREALALIEAQDQRIVELERGDIKT